MHVAVVKGYSPSGMFRLLAEPKVDELIQNKILLRMDIDLPDGRTIIHLLSPLKCTLSKLIPFPHRIQIGFETTVQVLMGRKVLKRSPTCTQWDFLVSLFHASQHSTCDGRDASQYKDYVLVLLFIKYISDKYAGVPYAPITIPQGASFKDMVGLKGKPDIGDQINKKIIAPLASANKLSDFPDFNDPNKLGSGKKMVDPGVKFLERPWNPPVLKTPYYKENGGLF